MHRDEARKRRHWVFSALGAVAVILVAWTIFHRKKSEPTVSPSVPVTVSKAATQDIPLTITALGAAQAWTSDTILAQVSGKLLSVNFKEGTDVKKGQVLAQVDPAPYQAALTQAEGTLKRDQALLADAKLDLARYLALKAQNAIATQMVDTQAALVQQDEGTVETDQGVVAAARINLAWCRIVSPVDGRVGVRLVDPGNLVSAGTGAAASTPATAAATNNSSSSTTANSGIVVVNQIEPIAVTFTVPEGQFQKLSDVSNGFQVPLETKAMSQETDELLDEGKLNIADNRIDPSTGTVELKARFPNAKRRLWPGQFVNVQLTLQTMHHVTTVPSAAVNRGPNGNFVYVVGPDNKAQMRPISVAWTQDVTTVIKDGVKPGETVVTDGQMTLKPGLQVRFRSPTSAAKAQK
jgi:membrane fusion protein, multidrug efflux system